MRHQLLLGFHSLLSCVAQLSPSFSTSPSLTRGWKAAKSLAAGAQRKLAVTLGLAKSFRPNTKKLFILQACYRAVDAELDSLVAAAATSLEHFSTLHNVTLHYSTLHHICLTQ